MGSPRRYADHIMGTWRYLHGTDDALREIRESVYMNGSTPEFLDEIRAALPDTVPELRRLVEEITAERRARVRR